jgi:DNA replication protein DnaD
MMATKLIQNILKMSQAIKKVPNFLDQNSILLSWKKPNPKTVTEESKKRTSEPLKTPDSKKKKLNQKNKKKDAKKKK